MDVSRPRVSSSNVVVAEVEYESCADELRLCGGDGRLNKPSDPRAPGPLDIDLLSPVPFINDTDPPLVKFVFGLLEVLGRFRSFCAGVAPNSSVDSLLLASPPDKGLGGRLAVRTPPRGG